MKWEKVPFGELFACPTRNGVYKSKEYHGTGVKIINMGEVFAYDFIEDQEMQRIAMTEAEMRISSVQNGDLLFARRSLVESGAGKATFVRKITEPMTFESSIIRVRLAPEKCYPLFYLYWLRSIAGRTAIAALVTGTNVKGIRGSELKDILVDRPPLETQHHIADILSAYDDLIENNQRQIKLLEEAAQRLYKEWFVDLRFPGHETTPIIDGVPEGWSTVLLSDVASINAKSLPKNFEFDYIDYVDLGSVNYGHISGKTRYTMQEAPGRAKRQASNGDIIWGMVRPNLRSYALILHPKETDVFSTGFAILSAHSVPFSFLYSTVTTDAFVGYLVNCTNGAAYPAVKPEHFANAKMLIPHQETLNRFDKYVCPLFDQIHGLQKQNENLAEARDRLLPKLMNGELEA